MNPATHPPKRNDPCPCGSGKKFKKCCYGKQTGDSLRQSNPLFRLALIVAAIGILAVVVLTNPFRDQDASESNAASSVETTPAPWQYDAVNNKHWDPSHGHWHDGPPPSSASASTGGGTAQGASATSPAPWQYDAASNKHWDPTHGHWHDGPPPSQTPTP